MKRLVLIAAIACCSTFSSVSFAQGLQVPNVDLFKNGIDVVYFLDSSRDEIPPKRYYEARQSMTTANGYIQEGMLGGALRYLRQARRSIAQGVVNGSIPKKAGAPLVKRIRQMIMVVKRTARSR